MTGDERPSDIVVFSSLAALTVLTRLPFLSPTSFGFDPDAWRVALAAEHLRTTGEYVASRFPGYPVHEVGSALAWGGSALPLNAATALVSGLAAGFFSLILRRLGVRAYALGALAFALTPVVFVNSVVTMDYVWSLAFALGALYFALVRKPVIASILLGLAMGARITAAVWIVPLAWMLYHIAPGSRVGRTKEFARFAIVAAGVAALCYVPVITAYGSGFARFYDGALPIRVVLNLATAEVWGVVGFFAVAVALGYAVVRGRPVRRGRVAERALLLGAALFFVVFIRLPLEAGYLIPVVPLVLGWLALRLPNRGFAALCVALCVSPFVVDLEATSSLPVSALEPSLAIQVGGADMRLLPRGPLFTELARMDAIEDSLEALAEVVHAIPRPAIVLAGPMWTRVAGTLGERRRGLVFADSLGALWEGRSADPLSYRWPSRDSTQALPLYVLPGAPVPIADDPRLGGRVPRIVGSE